MNIQFTWFITKISKRNIISPEGDLGGSHPDHDTSPRWTSLQDICVLTLRKSSLKIILPRTSILGFDNSCTFILCGSLVVRAWSDGLAERITNQPGKYSVPYVRKSYPTGGTTVAPVGTGGRVSWARYPSPSGLTYINPQDACERIALQAEHHPILNPYPCPQQPMIHCTGTLCKWPVTLVAQNEHTHTLSLSLSISLCV